MSNREWLRFQAQYRAGRPNHWEEQLIQDKKYLEAELRKAVSPPEFSPEPAGVCWDHGHLFFQSRNKTG